MINKTITLAVLLCLTASSYGESQGIKNFDKMMNKKIQEKIITTYKLNLKYCAFYPDDKTATLDDISKWSIECKTPDHKSISYYHFLSLNDPNTAIMWETQYIAKYGSPWNIKGNFGKLSMIWKSGKNKRVGVDFEGHKDGKLSGMYVSYNTKLTNKYSNTLLDWEKVL